MVGEYKDGVQVFAPRLHDCQMLNHRKVQLLKIAMFFN
jgi:hypothetical protein